MKEIIERTEKGENVKLSEAKINPALYWAYVDSKTLELNTLNFSELIEKVDAEEIVNILRKAKYEKFTISTGFMDIFEILWKFKELGCQIGEMVMVKQSFKHWDEKKQKLVHSFKPAITIIL